jgi:hypothetical protein
MAIVFDYVVTVVAVDKQGVKEEFTHPVAAYTLQEGAFAALLELEYEHNFQERGVKVKVKSVRPDIEKIGQQTREMLDELRKQMGR